MSGFTIERRPQLAAVARLLSTADLPGADLTNAHMEHFFYAGSSSAPLGVVGLEVRGPDALLRSLVVAPDCRGSGLGNALLEHAERCATSLGARSIFLLTTTAEPFFSRRGYAPADRASAPEGIRTSREFADLCPASAAFLVKRIS